MPDVPDVAQAVMDAGVVQMSAILPLVAGGTVLLFGAVVACVAGLCYVELRTAADNTGSGSSQTARDELHNRERPQARVLLVTFPWRTKP